MEKFDRGFWMRSGIGLGIGVMVGVGVSSAFVFPSLTPIKVAFDDNNEADTRRDLGVLPKEPIQAACMQAVDAYMNGKTDKVIVTLPKREDLKVQTQLKPETLAK